MRLIDADALIADSCRDCPEELRKRCKTEPACADTKFLFEIPTVDAVPVVHGRWNNMDGYKTRKVCSECGWDVPEYGKFYSYCPNCGAKMDGGNGDAAD